MKNYVMLEYTPKYTWCKALTLDLLQTQKQYFIQVGRPSSENVNLMEVCGRTVGYYLSNTKPGVINIAVEVLNKKLMDTAILVDSVQMNMCSVHTDSEDHELRMFYFEVREGSNND